MSERNIRPYWVYLRLSERERESMDSGGPHGPNPCIPAPDTPPESVAGWQLVPPGYRLIPVNEGETRDG